VQVKQQDVLQHYLVELLKEVDEKQSVEPAQPTDAAEEILTKTTSRAASLPRRLSETEQAELNEAIETQFSSVEYEEAAGAELRGFEYDPQWREKPLQALTFSVGELNLAVPLTMLNRVQPLENVTAIYSSSPQYLGLITSTLGHQIRVVNTMALVMPEKNDETVKESYTHVLMAEGYSWGLGVSTVEDSIVLCPDEVQWRINDSKRPWFAGIIKDRMCGLLDMYELDKILTE